MYAVCVSFLLVETLGMYIDLKAYERREYNDTFRRSSLNIVRAYVEYGYRLPN